MWTNKLKRFPATAGIARADISKADEGITGEGLITNKIKS